ncbi:MAG: hypothetical protein LBI89_00935 [Prevotellaceae bacterium]|jgi:hypothetical protein|nr:hypothetical protein [Prevotellaceae bacterium]
MAIQRLLFSTATVFMGLLYHAPGYAQQLRWQWAVQAHGAADNRIGGTACDTARNIYLTGSFSDSIRFGSFHLASKGEEDIFLLKLDPEGNVLWAKPAGGPGNDYPTAMTVSPAGMLYTAGFHGRNIAFDSWQSGEKNYNLFISLYAADGELKWVKSFGAKRSDYITSIAVDSLGSVYFGGYFERQLRLDEQHIIKANKASDAFIGCLDSLGTLLWIKSFGGLGDDRVSALHVKDSLLWIAGHCTAAMHLGTATISPLNNEHHAVFMACCSPAGEILRVHGNVSGRAATADCIIGLEGGKSIVAGNFSDSLFLDNTVLESYGSRDMFMAAFDSAGGLLWQKQIGSAAYDQLFDILHHPWGHIIITGLYSAPLIFDRDTIGLNNSYCDVFAASFDGKGRLQEINVMGGKAEEFPRALTHDREGHVYIAGLFRDTTTLRHATLTSAGTEEIFLAKLYHCNKNKVIFACDTVFSEGDKLALKTEGQYVAYDWEQGISKEATYAVTCSKVYQLRVEDSLHCTYRDSIAVRQIPVAPKIQIRADLHYDEMPHAIRPIYYALLRRRENENI